MAKMTEAALTKALVPMTAILKGWSSCDLPTLAFKVEKAEAEIDRLKAENGPWKKAKSDAQPLFNRYNNNRTD